MVGSHPALGEWDIGRSAPLEWTMGDLWQGEVRLPAIAPKACSEGGAGTADVYFKFVIQRDGHPRRWEEGQNRVILAKECDGDARISCKFGDMSAGLTAIEAEPTSVEEATIEGEGGASAARAAPPPPRPPPLPPRSPPLERPRALSPSRARGGAWRRSLTTRSPDGEDEVEEPERAEVVLSLEEARAKLEDDVRQSASETSREHEMEQQEREQGELGFAAAAYWARRAVVGTSAARAAPSARRPSIPPPGAPSRARGGAWRRSRRRSLTIRSLEDEDEEPVMPEVLRGSQRATGGARHIALSTEGSTLAACKLAELREMCRARGLRTWGTKQMLAERLEKGY